MSLGRVFLFFIQLSRLALKGLDISRIFKVYCMNLYKRSQGLSAAREVAASLRVYNEIFETRL